MKARRCISHSRVRVARTAYTALAVLAIACASAKGGAESSAGASTAASAEAARPRLVVMIVVDQFREPYLERYTARARG